MPDYFPARGVSEEVGSRHVLDQDDVIDPILVEEFEGLNYVHDTQVGLQLAVVFEDVESGIDEAWLGLKGHHAADEVRVEGSP